MSEEKSSVYAVCQNVRMKNTTSYKTGKKLMNEDIKRKIYKSKDFHSDILTIQYLQGLSGFFILTNAMTNKLTRSGGKS